MDSEKDIPRLCGSLNKPYGLKGFERAEIGHPVFENNNYYLIYLMSLEPLETVTDRLKKPIKRIMVEVPFYKDTFRHCIDVVENYKSPIMPITNEVIEELGEREEEYWQSRGGDYE